MEGSNPEADPSLAQGNRKRRISGGPSAPEGSTAKPAKTAAPASRPAVGTTHEACGDGKRVDAGTAAGVGAGAGAGASLVVGHDRRWTAGIYVDVEGVARMAVPGADAYADAQQGRWAEALVTSPLAEVRG